MFEKLRQKAYALATDRRGLTTVEYVIVLCLIAAIGVGTWQQLGVKVDEWLGGAKDRIETEMNKGGGEAESEAEGE